MKTLSLSKFGTGSLKLGTEDSTFLIRASVNVRSDGTADVGLSSLEDRPARLCSIGEQQRIALARAWALRPDVLFLDEPTASLDPAATRAVEEVIVAMHDSGTTHAR